MTSTMAAPGRNGTEDQTVLGRVASVVADAGTQVRTTATDTTAVVAERAPAALAASRGIIGRALAGLHGSSEGSLALGTVFTVGMSSGMLLSRAPRLLVALSLVPTLLLGGTLLGRWGTHAEEPSHRART